MQQRQSLGSPLPSSPSDDPLKLRRRSRPASAAAEGTLRDPDRSIHLIPLLTLVCFLILYLLSHEPSPADMDSFRGGALHLEKVVARSSHRGLKVLERIHHRKVRAGRR